MNNQIQIWSEQYEQTKLNPVYPTEWVIRTITGGNYPNLKLDKSQYIGKKILDMSCGDGRNLKLLLNLGFDVYASEISSEIINPLRKRFPEVKFSVGFNNKQPFENSHFDYILSCAACYYLESDTNFQDNLNEIIRILKTDAYFFGNICDLNNSVLKSAIVNDLGEAIITNDPFNLRNGYRFQVYSNEDDLRKKLSTVFKNITIGSFHEDYYGLILSGYMFVVQKV